MTSFHVPALNILVLDTCLRDLTLVVMESGYLPSRKLTFGARLLVLGTVCTSLAAVRMCLDAIVVLWAYVAELWPYFSSQRFI